MSRCVALATLVLALANAAERVPENEAKID